SATELLDEHRTLGARPDEAHFATEHVDQLRELVERQPAQEPPDRRPPWIIGHRPDGAAQLLRVLLHRTELPDAEYPAIEPHALLTVEHRTSRGELDQQRDHHQ